MAAIIIAVIRVSIGFSIASTTMSTFFANTARPPHPIPNRESAVGSSLPEVAIETEGLGRGQWQRILELYDLPTTVRINDLEARKLPTLFLDVELARLVYHMV